MILIAELVYGLKGKIGADDIVDFYYDAGLGRNCLTTEPVAFQLLAS